MSYNFYGWEEANNIEPKNNLYKGIECLTDLYDALTNVWCKETCAPRMQMDWTKENMTLGQCSITAFLVQDIFGGEVYGILQDGGNYHCYNVIDNKCFDLTSEQFQEKAKDLNYDSNPKQLRETHFSKAEKHARYELLKQKLAEYTGNI